LTEIQDAKVIFFSESVIIIVSIHRKLNVIDVFLKNIFQGI